MQDSSTQTINHYLSESVDCIPELKRASEILIAPVLELFYPMKQFCMPVFKGIILGILLTLSLNAIAQNSKPKNMVMADFQRFHFGYSVGISSSAFVIMPKDGFNVTMVQNPGININLITDYRLGKFLSVRFLPGIQFASRNITVIDKITTESKSWSIESVFVDLPLLLKYRSQRVNNYAPYLIAGINPRLGILGHELPPGGFGKATRMIKAFDIYPEIGAGCDFYISMAKVAVELKFCVGMMDIFTGPSDPLFGLYVSGIDKMFSRMVVLAFHVEQSR
jgi:hypothetical protein